MKKAIALILCLAALLTVLAGCGCEHEWKSAKCETPKTCRLCGETEGEALGHDWEDATCLEPKICRECDEEKGEPLGHDWVEATCELPKHCQTCNEIEGVVLEHEWQEATTEAPKTCVLCQKTEGERIITDARFTTEACKELFGTWRAEYMCDGEKQLGVSVPGEDLDFLVYMTFTFGNDGTMTMVCEYDEDSFKNVTRVYTIELLYATFAEQGYTREQTDQLMLENYGKSTVDYVEEQVAAMDVEDYTMEENYVYYVQDGSIYAGEDWQEELEQEEYSFRDGKLVLNIPDMGEVEFEQRSKK